MGTWGFKNFENDTAIAFVDKILESNKNLIRKKIEYIADYPKDKFLKASACEEALAAIEFVAAAKDKPSSDFSENDYKWLLDNDVSDYSSFFNGIFHKTIDVVELSMKAIDRIKNHSELKDLWLESELYNSWLDVLDDLKERVK